MACRGSIKQKHPWGRLGDTTEHQLSQTNGMSRFNQTETSFNKLRTYVNQIRTYVRIQFQEAYCTTRRRVICGGWRVGSWEEENHGSGAEEQQIFELFWNPMQACVLVQLFFNFKQSIKKWQAHWTALRNLALCRRASANWTHDLT